jgi:hypothetical protein
VGLFDDGGSRCNRLGIVWLKKSQQSNATWNPGIFIQPLYTCSTIDRNGLRATW